MGDNMKISFDSTSLQKLQNSNRSASYDTTKSVAGAGLSYDISSSLSEGNSYGAKGMSVSEFKDTLKAKDVQISQDYMMVMSSSMSDKDFAEFVRNGGKPESVEVEDSVTILDRIKLAVAKSGADIKGFTDTLDSSTIESLTGLKSLEAAVSLHDVTVDEELAAKIGEAVSNISEVTELTEGMKKDLVADSKELTINNLYMAKHSSPADTKEQGATYFAIETPGYLAKKGEGISGEELRKEVTDLLLSINIEPNVDNVEAGSWLVDNSLLVNKENLEKVKELNTLSFPIRDEDLSRVIAIAVSEGKAPKDAVLTAKETVYEKAVSLTKEIEALADNPFIKASRILEETRLKMTTQANLLLLKSNVSIDTKDLESYVEELKKLEEGTAFKEAEALTEVSDTVETVMNLPVQILYSVSTAIKTISLSEIASEGTALQKRYEAASLTYEAVGTKVRKDLGDSIKKAFRNIPEILESLGLDNTEENNRAVRILGYNSMPVTKESIEKISEADRKLMNVLTRLSPKDTLDLIRENKSPIRMSVEELNEYLDNRHDTESEEIEKYSKFLYKLERDKNITEDERKQYIEVYRFINKLEKTGFAAVGNVISTGREFSFDNLRTAIKSMKNRGMDVKVGENLDLLAAPDNEESLEREWIHEKLTQYKEAMNAPEETVTELVMSSVPVTAENLEAALLLRQKRGEAFKKATDASSSKARGKALSFKNALTDKPMATKVYEEMASECKTAVYEECMKKDSFVDVRELQLVHKQLTVTSSYSRQENYEIPIEIGGQVTSANVKLVHNKAEESNVVISLEAASFGRISARLSSVKGEISGYIACNEKDTVKKMQSTADILGKAVSVVFSKNSDSDLSLARIPLKDNDDSITTAELYGIARKFLDNLKGLTDEN